MTSKRNTLSFGTYPEVPLADARQRQAGARKLLAAGIDPGEQREAAKAAGAERAANTFAALAAEYLATKEATLSAGTLSRERRLAEQDLAPIADLPVTEISNPALLGALRKIETGGVGETAHPARALADRVFRYAIITGNAERNPATDLRCALQSPKTQHFASITELARVAGLLRSIWGYDGSSVTLAA